MKKNLNKIKTTISNLQQETKDILSRANESFRILAKKIKLFSGN
jgi:hypothetical protein